MMAPNPELSYLDRVVMEILETERMYVRDLHSIVEGYLAHIIDTEELPIIPEQVCALFGNIEDIYEFNSELLQELDSCKNDPVAIARCFVLKRDYFEIYTQYCTNYPNSVAALTECMRNKTLLKFFMERQEALKHPLPLGSYLLKPVQRILKYHLLLQEIAKHFDPDEDGYDVVEEAINTMTEVAWYINTMKRKHEHAVRLQEVQSLLINWRGPDLTTYGELVLEGTFRFHHTKNNRTLFLFERVLLITKRRGENFIYKTHISCSTLMLMEGAKDPLCFSVTHYKHPKQPHIVQARTMEEKKLWTHHIKRLILENHHTTIPQKAKEVILEMDPMYQKYKFNSERKKKTQSDDFTHTRQSAMLKHSVSEGELRENLMALGSTSGSVQALSVDDRRLSCFNRENATHCELQDEEEKGSDSDDVITEDFSSSMISCWSFRAKALLQINMDEEWQEHGDTRLSQQEERHVCEDLNTNKASPSMLKFQSNTTEIGSTMGLKSMSDSEQAKIRQNVFNVSSVEGSDQYEVKEEIVPNQDGQSSEEEVEDDTEGSENHSILPSSVLDKAGVIAEHFIVNPRCSSASPGELGSPQRTKQEVTSSKNTPSNFNILSPREERVSGSDRHVYKRRDSTLSKQEQLLIDKIRTYYENAEQQDTGFSLKRRESLTYIPSGVVRTSVSHFNKIPCTDHRSKPPNMETVTLPASSDINIKPDKLRDLFSTEFDGSVSHKSEEISEECFRSSADMIKVWQEMEKDVTRSLKESTFRDLSQFRGTNAVSRRFSRNTEDRVREQDLMATDDLCTITEESPVKVKEDENEKEPTGNPVLNLTKKFSQHIQSRETFNQSRRRASETTINAVNEVNIPSLTDEDTKKTLKGKKNLALPLTASFQTTQDIQTHTSSSNRVTVLSPEHSHLKSPMQFEGFPWPAVSELRSIYTSLECTPPTPLTSAANTLSQGCSMDSKASRIQRAGSLDQKLAGFGWNNLQNKKVNSDYCISAQATLPNNRTIAVVEKCNKTHTCTSQTQNHVQINYPLSREKTSLLSVTERCRLYEDLDEGAFRTEAETRNKDNKTDQQISATQQGVVKNLREKFLNPR